MYVTQPNTKMYILPSQTEYYNNYYILIVFLCIQTVNGFHSINNHNIDIKQQNQEQLLELVRSRNYFD